jgi:hypothetical protein
MRTGGTARRITLNFRLDLLSRESAEEMFDALLGESANLAPLKRKKRGQALFEEGALHRNGVVRLAQPLAQMRVPTTVQSVLASRIDGCRPNKKSCCTRWRCSVASSFCGWCSA